jgi:uncharacterized protein HemX
MLQCGKLAPPKLETYVLKLLAVLAVAAVIVMFVRRQMKRAARRRRYEERERRLEIQQQRWDEAMGQAPVAASEGDQPPPVR